MFFSALRAVTVAPGMTAPEGSLTTPLRLADVASACAIAATAPRQTAKTQASVKRYAVGSHRRGEAHITLFSLERKMIYLGEAWRARRIGRTRHTASRISKIARAERDARRELFVRRAIFKGGLWLSGFQFERRKRPASACVRPCTLKTAPWQESCQAEGIAVTPTFSRLRAARHV